METCARLYSRPSSSYGAGFDPHQVEVKVDMDHPRETILPNNP